MACWDSWVKWQSRERIHSSVFLHVIRAWRLSSSSQTMHNPLRYETSLNNPRRNHIRLIIRRRASSKSQFCWIAHAYYLETYRQVQKRSVEWLGVGFRRPLSSIWIRYCLDPSFIFTMKIFDCDWFCTSCHRGVFSSPKRSLLKRTNECMQCVMLSWDYSEDNLKI